MVAYSFVNPFIPLFLSRELGFRDHSQLAVWSGLLIGLPSIAAAVANPFWGWFGDRYGRRPVVIRAMVSMGLTTLFFSFVTTAAAAASVRLLQGLTSAVNAASAGLVAAGTPGDRVSSAFGWLSSARSVGLAAGPLAAGVLASFLPLRIVFAMAGIVILAIGLALPFVLRESIRPTAEGSAGPASAAGMRTLMRSAYLRRLLVLVIVIHSAFNALQQLLILQLVVHDASAVTIGLAFGAVGVGIAIAGPGYSAAIQSFGYRGVITLAAIATAAAALAATLAAQPAVFIGIAAAYGLGFGALNPAFLTLIGLHAPAPARSTAIGLCFSAQSIGQAVGPISSGLIAGFAGLTIPIVAAAATLGVVALAVRRSVREPPTAATVSA
jgi:MFS family permease